ncbi:MAG: GlsB/YeaQ/YmgE family stress response membrane protein [Planctomycetales bacterium]|nr:GlsB/YeaQ/YmgE family stress response membrane protein [Planctomycetales bacterium]
MNGLDAAHGLVLNDSAQQLVNDVLTWIGFGTVIGLLAKGIMPGRDPGGAIATVLMGIGGTVIGCGILSYFYDGQRVIPVSPMGMLVGTGGTLVILFFYKMLGGYYFVEGEYVTRSHRRRTSSRRRRYDSTVYED